MNADKRGSGAGAGNWRSPAWRARPLLLVLLFCSCAGAQNIVGLKETDGAVEILYNNAPVLRYNHAIVPPPKGQSVLYARSGFVHPLNTPAGVQLSRIHPADHIHHLGLWNPWTKATFEGRHIDFWNLREGTATVRFVKYESKSPDGFVALLDHIDLRAPGGEKVVLHERLSVRVIPHSADVYLLDLISVQRCATDSPLIVEQYRYGGLGLRLDGDLRNPDCLTSEGKSRKDGNGTAARWFDSFATTAEGKIVGSLWLSHPRNPVHPETMRIWPDGYFVNFCPVVNAPLKIEPGRPLTLRYRIAVHDGNMTAAAAEQLWKQFAQAPE